MRYVEFHSAGSSLCRVVAKFPKPATYPSAWPSSGVQITVIPSWKLSPGEGHSENVVIISIVLGPPRIQARALIFSENPLWPFSFSRNLPHVSRRIDTAVSGHSRMKVPLHQKSCKFYSHQGGEANCGRVDLESRAEQPPQRSRFEVLEAKSNLPERMEFRHIWINVSHLVA